MIKKFWSKWQPKLTNGEGLSMSGWPAIIVLTAAVLGAQALICIWNLPDKTKYSIPEIAQKIQNIQLTEIKIAIILRIVLAIALPCAILYYVCYLYNMIDLTIQKDGKLSEKELIALMVITTGAVSAMVFMIYKYSLNNPNKSDSEKDEVSGISTKLEAKAQEYVNLIISLTTEKKL